MTTVTFRNALTDLTQQVDIQPGQTVRQAVEYSGLIAAGNNFSVRDKEGRVVDDEQVATYSGQMLSVGLPGDGVVGGAPARAS